MRVNKKGRKRAEQSLNKSASFTPHTVLLAYFCFVLQPTFKSILYMFDDSFWSCFLKLLLRK